MTVELEHGKSQISVEGDIITVKAVGAYNTEGIIQIISAIESEIKSFKQKEFKLLFDYLQVEGGTPDVFDKINDCNIWLNTQNMVAKALVINSSMLLNILESRTPARKVQNSKSFYNIESAMHWLHSQS